MGQLNYTTAKVNELLAKTEEMPDSVKDGKTPVLETGTTQTLSPGQNATAEVVADGTDDEGNPKYKLNFGIPRGADGKDGSGTGGGGGTADEVDWNNVQGKPSWVDSSTKPTYTAEEVGALPNSTKIPAKTSQLENDSGFLTKTSLKTVNGQSLVGSGDITVEGGGGGSAPPLTGNVTTHRHDTVYAAVDLGTDTWDGTSVSASLQGQGTKDDPYLIGSCADWIHLYRNAAQYATGDTDPSTASEFKPVFKLVKNLDFGNQEIAFTPPSAGDEEQLDMAEFDGNRAKIANFKVPVAGGVQYGVFPPCLSESFIHDFMLENIQIEADCSLLADRGLTLYGIPGNGMAINLLNNTIDIRLTVTGNVSEMTAVQLFVDSGYTYANRPNTQPAFDSYVEENGHYAGCRVELADNTVKADGGKLLVVLISMYATYETPAVIYCATPLEELDESGSFSADSGVGFMIMGKEPKRFYTLEDGSGTVICQDIESGTLSQVAAVLKSESEMKSGAFTQELNSLLPSPVFGQDPRGGYPLLQRFTGGIAYDGYVTLQEFEAYKESVNLPQGGGGEGTGGVQADAYYLPEAVFSLSAGASAEDVVQALGGQAQVLELAQEVLENGKKAWLHKYDSAMESYTIPVSVTCFSLVMRNLFISYSSAYESSITASDVPSVVHTCIFVSISGSNEVTGAGIKKVYENGYELSASLISLTNESTSEEVSAAIGGLDGLKAAIQAVKDGNRLVMRGAPPENLVSYISAYNADMQVSSYSELENGDFHLSFSIFAYMVIGMGHMDMSIGYDASAGTFSALVNNLT